MTDDEYEVLAIRYATWPKRFRWQNFHRGDPHDDAPMPLDFYVWAIRNGERTIVVDTGYDAAEAAARDQPITHEPREALAMAGIDCTKVEDVVQHLPFGRWPRPLLPSEMPLHQIIGFQHPGAFAHRQHAGEKRQLQRPFRRLAAFPGVVLLHQHIVVDIADRESADLTDEP